MNTKSKIPGLLSFDVSDEDSRLIDAIVGRAIKDLEITDRLSAEMDITACHANGNPLRLKDLLEAPLADFGHDFHGIRRYLDRDTGELTNWFSPRYSVPEAER